MTLSKNPTKRGRQMAHIRGRTTLPMVAIVDIKSRKLFLSRGLKTTTKKDAFESVPRAGANQLNKRKFSNGSVAIVFTKQVGDKRIQIKPPFVVQKKIKGNTRAIRRITKTNQLNSKDRRLLKVFNNGLKTKTKWVEGRIID